MPQLEHVIWTKGTFLNPQHLQIQDRFLESSLQFRLRALNFRPWGFARLRVDPEALAGGSFAVTQAAGIFPDGMLFDIPEADSAPPPKPVAEGFEDGREQLDIYLAVPYYREGGVNVTTGQRDPGARYRAEIAKFSDENTGSAERPVQIARKNLRLLTDIENREGMSSLRIGRILRSPAGLLKLDPHFAPPLLDFAANDYLISIARRIFELLSVKSSLLSGARRQKNQSLAEFTASEVASFWLLYTVNTWLPVFRHLFETRHGHPESLYNAMLGIAGSLTTFSASLRPRDLPLYDHDDLGACFTDLDEKLRLLLETVVPSNFVSLPLKLVSPSIYATSLDDEKYLVNTRMYLAMSAETSQADLIGRAPQLVKIGSANEIERLVTRALPGVPLTHLPAPPAAIPVKLHYEYFSLNQSGPAWEAIAKARTLAAYVPGDFPNPQLELAILLPAS